MTIVITEGAVMAILAMAACWFVAVPLINLLIPFLFERVLGPVFGIVWGIPRELVAGFRRFGEEWRKP